jgi:hypothetical protein
LLVRVTKVPAGAKEEEARAPPAAAATGPNNRALKPSSRTQYHGSREGNSAIGANYHALHETLDVSVFR